MDDPTIVRSYFPRDVRHRPDLVVDEVRDRCARCARDFAGEHGFAHVWKLRGMGDAAGMVALCDGCDRLLRPRAYRRFAEAARGR